MIVARRNRRLSRAGIVIAAIGLAVLTAPAAHPSAPAAHTSAGSLSGAALRTAVAQRLRTPDTMSSGLRTWLAGRPSAARARRAATPVLGTTVDANNPALDLAAGQSETGIAAQRSGARTLVLAAWNDISGALADPTTRAGSVTGVGLSRDGGRHFNDLIGLPNNNTDQQWFGDPTVAALGDGHHFAVGSLYYPSFRACTDGLPAYGTVAVSIASVTATGVGFTAPVPVALPGDLCALGGDQPPADLATLDKDWIAYSPASRTLAVSYARLFIPADPICTPSGCTTPPGGHSGLGRIEIVRAHVPSDPTKLSTAAFGTPVVVWPEEPNCPDATPSSEATRCGALNTGAYVAVAPGGDAYVAWERNINTNAFNNGDPSVHLHAALVPAGLHRTSVGGTVHPVVLTNGQPNARPGGGVKSLDTVPIAGYSRGTGQDFPRLAIDARNRTVVFEWNDASVHPLGDIWLRTASFGLGRLTKTVRVNDDASFAMHFMPAVSVRADGTICSSWYDRRLGGPDSTRTNYFADCRTAAATNAPDIRITPAATDWAGTSSFINPNFGDYTDNATDGAHTYFTWSDGRLGIPQPFVAVR
jgi:hypothetical protein